MLKFAESTKEVKDNEIKINGHVIGMVTDEVGEMIISLVKSGSVSPATKMLNMDTKDTAPAPANQKTEDGIKDLPVMEQKDTKFQTFTVPGRIIFNDDAVTLKQDEDVVHLEIHIPVFWGKKGAKNEKDAKQRRDYIKDQYKKTAKLYGAKWAGNYDAGDIHWDFTIPEAKKYIQYRKEEAEKSAKSK